MLATCPECASGTLDEGPWSGLTGQALARHATVDAARPAERWNVDRELATRRGARNGLVGAGVVTPVA